MKIFNMNILKFHFANSVCEIFSSCSYNSANLMILKKKIRSKALKKFEIHLGKFISIAFNLDL